MLVVTGKNKSEKELKALVPNVSLQNLLKVKYWWLDHWVYQAEDDISKK